MNAKRVKKKTLKQETRHEYGTGCAPLRVVSRPGERRRGWLFWRGRAIPVALGRSGIRHDKREGDGATPAGTWRLVELRFRGDHIQRPMTGLKTIRTRREDGWCDDPQDRCYNRPVRLPYPASHEEMWRPDRLYDLVIVLDHNTRPRKARGGSAVFLHLAREGFEPTAGCVAFRPADLRRLLKDLCTGQRLKIE